MKIAVAQLNYTIGDFEGNKAKIVASVERAKGDGADLVVFCEEAVSGAFAYDLLNKVTFLELCEDVLEEVALHCDTIAALVGTPIASDRTTVSAAALLRNGRIERYIGRHTVTGRDDVGHLRPGKGGECVDIAGKRVAVLVGEDVFAGNSSKYGNQADVIVSLITDAYKRHNIDNRYNFYRKLSYMSGIPVVYANMVGGNTDVVFDGSSAVFNGQGHALRLLKSFDEDYAVVDLDAPNEPVEIPYISKNPTIYNAIKLGLKDFFAKNGFKTACIGLSGGIDSAVVAAIAVDALGVENVRALMLPSQFSSDHSVEDAVLMAERLGMQYNVVPITEAYKTITDSMKPVIGGLPFDVTEENIQSRIRCVMLMALSNKYGCVLLNTTNKSEEAVGYGTLYGDCVGVISVLGDLYKREVFELARYLNRDTEVIPENILVKEPSAELRPEQKDTDFLPPYDVVDAILFRMFEEGQHREEIVNAGFEANVVYKIHAMVMKNEQKRYQFCPVLRMSICPLGKGRVMPLTSKYGY